VGQVQRVREVRQHAGGDQLAVDGEHRQGTARGQVPHQRGGYPNGPATTRLQVVVLNVHRIGAYPFAEGIGQLRSRRRVAARAVKDLHKPGHRTPFRPVLAAPDLSSAPPSSHQRTGSERLARSV